MPNMQARCLALLVAVIPLAAAQPTSGQAYPAKPVRLVVPYAPGAGADLHARALAQKMTETLGQTVIVENRSGANGTLAKAKPGSLVLASAGTGSAGHLCLELFKTQSGVQVLHVPYKGAAPSMIDLIAGHAQLSFLAWSTAGPFVKGGKLRAMGVTSAKRATVLPDLPAIAETLPGFDITNWYGIAGPKGMPRAIVTKLNGEVLRALSAPDLRAAFEKEAIEIIGSTPEAFGEYLKSELVKWGRLVKSSGLKVD